MGKNYTRKLFYEDSTWTCPAGVKSVRVSVYAIDTKKISGGKFIAADGNVYSTFGNLGNGTLGTASSPVLVSAAFFPSSIDAPYPGGNAFALQGGRVYGWGYNGEGQLGDNTLTSRSTPTLVAGPSSRLYRQISTASNFTLAVTIQGQVYGWGRNNAGQLGSNTPTETSSPALVLLPTEKRFVQAEACGLATVVGAGAALSSDGEVYCWGRNTVGLLGDGTTNDTSSPVAVIGGHRFRYLTSGNNATDPNDGCFLALDSRGDVWAWGSGAKYRFGNGDDASLFSSPTLVISGMRFKKIKASSNVVLGIDVTGDVFVWGDSPTGLGLGATTVASTPTLLAGFKATDIDTDGLTSHLITPTGKVYGWGGNTGGKIGDNSTTDRLTPVLVDGVRAYDSMSDFKLGEIVSDTIPGETYTVSISEAVPAFGQHPLASFFTTARHVIEVEYWA